MNESYDHSWTCREDSGIERNQSFKENDGSAQFSLCCTSTAMPDDDSQDRHPAFCFPSKESETSEQNAVAAVSHRQMVAIGNQKSKINGGPDWARTSDPALIKRML
jgi:hypothetical protein